MDAGIRSLVAGVIAGAMWLSFATHAAEQNPEVVKDLESRLVAYAKAQKPSLWFLAQPGFLGPQGETAFDPGFDLSDGGLPRERPVLPAR
jgi:hypothetical protein